MNIILFETQEQHLDFLPFTFTKPLAHLRIGILRIFEKWERLAHANVSSLAQNYLQKIFPAEYKDDNFYINAGVLPSLLLIDIISNLPKGSCLKKNDQIIAFRTSEKITLINEWMKNLSEFIQVECTLEITILKNRWDIFQLNHKAITSDYELLTIGRKSAKLSPTNTVIGNPEHIFIEEGATVEASVFNTKTGVVYIGKDAEIMEGCMVRGPFALNEHGTLKMGAKIYGATTIGPHCKVGGEVNNSVFQAYSNKAHDGFIGNSVIGEWCNLGADTNNSNLKNNYSSVDVWSYKLEKYTETGLQFCGLMMGDHSRSGINTMFNTGTTVGVCSNIFGSDFPPKFIPSFSWGGAQWLRTFAFDKGIEAIERMMQRRNVNLSEPEREILKYVFEYDSKWRKQ